MQTRLIIIILSLLMPSIGWAAAFTSKATGNWSASGQTTWTQVGVPGTGDTVTIQAGHTVTVDVNTTIGNAPAADTCVVTVAATGAITTNAGTTWTVRGGICNDGVITQNGNVAANGAVGQVYTWKIGTVNNSPNAHWVALGTSGTHITLVVAASSCIVRFDDGLGNLNTGYFDAQYLDITRLGDATRNAFAPNLANSTMKFSLQDGSCTTCGGIASPQSVADGATWRIKNFTFVTSAGGNVVYGGSGTYTTGTRLIDGSVFDTQVRFYSTAGLTVTNSLFNQFWDFTGTTVTLIDGNLIQMNDANPVSADFSVSNNYFLKNGAIVNPHYLSLSGNASATVSGNVFEMPDGSNGAGDCILLVNTATTVSHTITHNIALPNGSGGDSGSPTSLLGGVNVTLAAFEHNTYYAAQGLNIGETYAGRANVILSAKNNIAWHNTANTGYKVRYDPGTSIPGFTDYVTSANANNNGGFNLQAGSNAKGYDNMAFSSGSPGANDVVNVDPQFVNSSTGIKAWDASLGGPGTTANALAQLKLRNLSGYNSAYTIAALLTKIKADMAPRNVAYKVATDNVSPSFSWLGAVEGISTTCRGSMMLLGVGC